MKNIALRKFWFVRPLIATIAVFMLMACHQGSGAALIDNITQGSADTGGRKTQGMDKKSMKTLDGTPLYTGPEQTPKFSKGLTIIGYNYTDSAITGFSVNGAGGGNIEVSSLENSHGGGTCCAPIPQETPLPIPVKIKWQHSSIVKRTSCEQTVLLTGPMPAVANYFEVHFYQDGTIQVAITDDASRPRILMDRYNPALRKPSGNVNNDFLHGRCGDE